MNHGTIRLTVSGAILTAFCYLSMSAAPAALASASAKGFGSVTAVSCSSRDYCWAGATEGNDGVVLSSRDGGTKWAVQTKVMGVDGFTAIDCPSASRCIAIVNTSPPKPLSSLLETSDGGKTWAERAVPRSVFELQAISCAGGSRCVAIGTAPRTLRAVVITTSNGGHSWTKEPTPVLLNGMSNPFGVVCMSPSRCVAVGTGAALTSTDGGATWTKHTVSGNLPLDYVTCPSAMDCIAEGNVTSAIPKNTAASLLTSSSGGASWYVRVAKVPSVTSLNGVSCSSVSSCVSVASGYGRQPKVSAPRRYGVVERSRNGGKSWIQMRLFKVGSLFGVSCVTGTSDCVAVGETSQQRAVILRTVDDGQTWALEPLPTAR